MADPFAGGVVVVVVVVRGVEGAIDALVTTRVPLAAFSEESAGAEVVGVTTLSGGVGKVVVVLVLGTDVPVDKEGGECRVACPSFDTASSCP